MGGYVGRQIYFVTIRYGVVVQGRIDSPSDEYFRPARNICGGV